MLLLTRVPPAKFGQAQSGWLSNCPPNPGVWGRAPISSALCPALLNSLGADHHKVKFLGSDPSAGAGCRLDGVSFSSVRLPRIRQSDKTNGIFPSPTLVGAAGVFATAVNLTRVLDLSTERFKERLRTNSAESGSAVESSQRLGLALNRAV